MAGQSLQTIAIEGEVAVTSMSTTGPDTWLKKRTLWVTLRPTRTIGRVTA